MIETRFSDVNAAFLPAGRQASADFVGAGPVGIDVLNGKPVFTLDQIVNQLTRTGLAWDGAGFNPVPKAGIGTITYAFFNFSFEVYSSERSGFQALSEVQRAAFRLAFDLWEDVIGVDFVEGTVATADINIGALVTQEDHFSAYARLPGNNPADGDIWLNAGAATNNDVQISQAGFRTIMHEIGHALGISHPGHYNAAPDVELTYAANAEYYQDSYQYTIMSYFGSSNTGAARTSFASTPFLHDVAAIQHLYGVNDATRTGDTVYGFNSNADRAVFDFTVNPQPVVTIWDAGGIDMLDFSGWSSDSTIDLSEGGFSHGGGQTHNVAIAFGTLIENASLGAGNDIVIGNDAANFVFLAPGGTDHVSGLGGDDGFYFRGTYDGLDRVDGGSGTDTLALQGQYDALLLGDVAGIEVLLLLPGDDARFGYLSGDPTYYALATIDSNVATGSILTVQASGLRAGGEALRFDGSAESDGHFRIFAGRDSDDLAGGQGDDGFFFGADLNFGGTDRIHGGAGIDSLALRGDHVGAGAALFQDDSFDGIEVLVLLSGRTNEYGGFIVAAGFDYALTMADGNVAAGQRVDLIALTLGAGEQLTFDGRAESDGAWRILSGAGDDVLTAGAGADYLYGGLGADRIHGGGGADIIAFRSADESRAASFDILVGFDAGFDLIDLPTEIMGLGATIGGASLSLASLASDLALLLADSLGIGEAVAVQAEAGDLAGRLFLVADGNGVAGYQADADFLFELVEPAAPLVIGTDFFL